VVLGDIALVLGFGFKCNYRICACISRTFFGKNLPYKIGVWLIHGILCIFFFFQKN
jgi:hypothetical protein